MSTGLPKLQPDRLIKALRDHSRALRKITKVDPTERYVLIFPNYERAFVGMGFNLLNTPAEEIYHEASKLVKRDLLKMCLDGPKSELLENRQIAAYVTSHATLAKLKHEQPHTLERCKAAGGIGVGLINSLVYCGSLSFRNGLEIVQKQAEAMERLAKVVPTAKLNIRIRPATPKGKMCRVAIEHCLKLGIPEEIAVCSVTKQISPHRLEVSGHEEAIKYLEVEGQRFFEFYSIRRVSDDQPAFNTNLMRPVSDFLRLYFKDKMNQDPNFIQEPQSFSLYSATAGHRVRKLERILEEIYRYPSRPIQIEQMFHSIYDREKSLAQPNTLVVWDKSLLHSLSLINKKASNSAKLLRA